MSARRAAIGGLDAQQLAAQKAAADEAAWNLQIELQNEKEARDVLAAKLVKLEAELKQTRDGRDAEQEANDDLRARQIELEDALSLSQKQHAAHTETQRRQEEVHEQDFADILDKVRVLEDERDTLRKQNRILSQRAEAVEAKQDTLGDESFDPNETPTVAAGSADLPQDTEIPSALLDVDSRNALFSRLQRQLQQARATIQRERSEKLELKRRVETGNSADEENIGHSTRPSDSRGKSRRLSWRPSAGSDTPQTEDDSDISDATSDVTEAAAEFPLSDDYVSIEELEQEAASRGFRLIPESQAVAEEAGVAPGQWPVAINQDSNLESIKKHLQEKYDARVLTTDEYAAISRPNKATLLSRANEIHHRLIPIEEYESLVNPSIESLDELAGVLNHKMVSSDELCQLRNPDLDALANERQLKVVPVDMWHRPPLQWLEEKAMKTGHMIVPSHQPPVSDYNAAPKETANSRSPTPGAHVLQDIAVQHMGESSTDLHELAHKQGLEVLAPDDTQKINELATRNGSTLVPVSALSELMDTNILPDAGLVERGVHPEMGEVLCLLSKADVERIHSHLVSPLISREELAELERRVHSPTMRDLAAVAATQGLTVMTVDAFEQAQQEAAYSAIQTAAETQPQQKSLEELAGEHGFALMDQAEKDALEKPDPATLSRLAKLHGLTMITDDEQRQIQELRTRASEETGNKPNEDSVDTWATENGKVIISSEDHQALLNLAHRAERRDPSSLTVSERRALHEQRIRDEQQGTSSPVRSEKSSSKRESVYQSLGYERVPREEWRRLLASQKVYEPTKTDIIRAAKMFDLVAVPSEEWQSLRRGSPHKSGSSGSSNTSSLPSTPIRKSQVSRKDASPGFTAAADADAGDFKAVPATYLDALRRIAEKPTRADVEAMAMRVGLQLVDPSKQSLDDSSASPDASLKLVETKARELGYIPSAEVRAKALDIGLVEPMSDSELLVKARHLGLVNPPNDTQILAAGKAKGLVEPPTDDEIVERATALGMVEASRVDDVARSHGLAEPLSKEEIIQKAVTLGLQHPLSDDELKIKAQNLGLAEPETDEEIRQRAGKLGLESPLSDAEIRTKALKLGLIEPLTDQEIRKRALQLGLVEPPTSAEIKQRAQDMGMVEPLSDAEIKRRALDLSLIEPLSDAEIQRRALLLGLIKPPTDSDIKQQASKLGLEEPLSEQDIRREAFSLGMVEPASDGEIRERAANLGMIKPLDDATIKKKALALGLIEPLADAAVIQRAQKLGLIHPLKDEAIKNKAKALGLVDKPKEADIIAAARAKGMVESGRVAEVAQSQGWIRPPSDADIKQRAMKMGLVVPLSDDEIKQHAAKLGLVEKPSKSQILAEARLAGLVDPPTDADIIQRGKSLGLVAPSGQEEQHPDHSRDIMERPRSSNVDTDLDKLGSAVSTSEGNGSGNSVDSQTKSDTSTSINTSPVIATAKDDTASQHTTHKLAEKPPSSLQASGEKTLNFSRSLFRGSASQTRHPDSSKKSDVVAVENPPAESTVQPNRDANAAEVSTTVNKPGPDAPLELWPESQSEFKPENEQINDHDAPKPELRDESEIRTGSDPIHGQNHKYEDGPGGARGLEASDSTEVKATNIKEQLDRARMPPPQPPQSTRGKNNGIKPADSRSHSHVGDMSSLQRSRQLGSMSTLSSFNLSTPGNTEVYKANVSQLLVGEILWKYIAGFSLDGEGHRHKRYFWLHPYSMTLYWQRENPAVLGGRVGTPRTLRILGVQEVKDCNPSPTGLYYKTIVIQGPERDVRITCPTRNRHFVWYTSLRYLLDVGQGGSGDVETSMFPDSLRDTTGHNL